MRILLVEDNPGDSRLISELLAEQGAGHEVVVAMRLGVALDLLKRHSVDAVLFDLGLPDATGLPGLRRIVGAAARVPVIVLTGGVQPELAVEALRAGAQDYLAKGELDGRVLLKTIRYAIERKRLQVTDEYLAEAGRMLAGSLDYDLTVESVGVLAVQSLADLCVLVLADDDTSSRRVHIARGSELPASVSERLDEIRQALSDPTSPIGSAAGIARPTILGGIQSADEHGDVVDPLCRSLRESGMRSCIVAPLVAHEQRLGAVVFASAQRVYGAEDLILAERLASVAALQIENAELYRRAMQAVRARDRVLGVVAHDLRNPLGIIAMSSDLILGGHLSEEQTDRQLRIVRRTAERMDRLIQDLLDVVRLEGDRLELSRSHEDAALLCREIVEVNTALATVKSIRLEAEAESSLPPILADRDRLLRTLENLVGNAIKFTPEGGRVVVRVERAEEPQKVRFSVTDTGPGIPAAELPNLFLPFWKSRRSPASGAGLGLAIARGLVEAHGGRIWAESEQGRGATIHFTIPAAEERRNRKPARA